MRLILWRYKSSNPIPAIGPREIRPYSPKFGDGPHTRPYGRYAQAKSGTGTAQQILIANATAIVKDPNCSGYLFHRQLVRTVGVRHAARHHSRLHLQPANLLGLHPADRQIVGGWRSTASRSSKPELRAVSERIPTTLRSVKSAASAAAIRASSGEERRSFDHR